MILRERWNEAVDSIDGVIDFENIPHQKVMRAENSIWRMSPAAVA